MMLFATLLLQTATLPAAVPRQDEQVVVLGPRLEQTGAALADCIARHCPPREEIAASVAHASEQFIAGDLDGARSTLHRARARNGRYAKTLPTQVSSLLAFDADIAGLTGYANWQRIGTIDSVSALRAGLASDDPRILAQRMRIADVFARQGRLYAAVAMYDRIGRDAAVAGQSVMRGRAMFGAAKLYAVAASLDPAFAEEARHRIAAVQQSSEPELQPFKDGTIALRARVAELAGRAKDFHAAVADAQAVRSADAVLISTPRVDLQAIADGSVGVGFAYDAKDQWVDLGFRIAPDGSVRDIVAQRSGARADKAWIAYMERNVAQRRYLPLAQAPDGPGLLRMERFLLVSDLGGSTRSRIRRAVGVPRVETVDLTREVERGSLPPPTGAAPM